MRLWPFRRHQPPCSRDAQPSDEAREALRQAQRGLVDARVRARAADQVAQGFAEVRRRNHLGEAVAHLMRRA